MDVNQTPYFLFREPADFDHGSALFAWDGRRGALVLAQDQALRLANTGPAAALDAWRAARALVRDPFGQIGRIHTDRKHIEVNAGREYVPVLDGELRGLVPLYGEFTDLTLGGDGRLGAIYADTDGDPARYGVMVFHLRRRWQAHAQLEHAPVRVLVDADNGVWCIGDGKLAYLRGEPLPHPYVPQGTRFEPLDENPHPLAVKWTDDLPAGLSLLAACLDAERLYLLARDATNAQQILVRALEPVPGRRLRSYPLADAAPFIVDIAPLGGDRLAGMPVREAADTQYERRDCAVLRLHWDARQERGSALRVRERYPMLSQAEPRFVAALDGKPRYQAQADAERPGFAPRPRELHPLARPQYRSVAQVSLRKELDSGRPGNVWHRLYLEGCIPPGCRLTVYAKAYDGPEDREREDYLRQPEPLWSPLASELPFHAGLVESRRGESGLFEILLQRPSGNVRQLAGRYLRLRLRMEGDGRTTPAVHAMRVYAPRFSYQEAYLPALFRQEEQRLPGPEGEALPANGADLRERFLAAFEGMLTPIEGRIAANEVLIDPRATPREHLPWLAELLGLRLPAHWPTARARELVSNVGLLQRWRGTLRGVQLALDIATDGGVARGQVVAVENFRLRRTMATILGVDMDDRDHPLTLGTGMSGNSIVGETLILSEEDSREFLALFAPELAQGEERAVVEAFFDRYSHQVSVLLHGAARGQRRAVEAILEEHMPAHLQWRVIETDHPFVLGLAPLLGVDTFVERTPPPRRVTLDDTYLGREGVLSNPLALSPSEINAHPQA